MNGLLIEMQYIAIIFFGIALVIYSLYRYSSRFSHPRKQKDSRRKIFACGEDIGPMRLNIPQESFYYVLIRQLGLERVVEWHNGQLSRYLAWVFAGMVIMILYFLLVW